VTAPIPTLRTLGFEPPLDAISAELVNELEFPKGWKIAATIDGATERAPRLAVGHASLPLAWRDGDIVKGVFPGMQCEPAIETTLASLFGGVVRTSVRCDWGASPHSQGTYGVLKPSQLTRLGPYLRAPHGRIYFAGAERSSWVNSMEGAVESGETVARRVLRRVHGWDEDLGRP
jgi:monoamine oxidase